jgi:hypothetical protein
VGHLERARREARQDLPLLSGALSRCVNQFSKLQRAILNLTPGPQG